MYKPLSLPRPVNIVDHPFMGRVELLSTYSREEAIDDGILVDCTQDLFDEMEMQPIHFRPCRSLQQ